MRSLAATATPSWKLYRDKVSSNIATSTHVMSYAKVSSFPCVVIFNPAAKSWKVDHTVWANNDTSGSSSEFVLGV